jgi:hypothetical protein
VHPGAIEVVNGVDDDCDGVIDDPDRCNERWPGRIRAIYRRPLAVSR